MRQPSDFSPQRISVLSIAGSDSGGGAGIQADLRSIAAHGLHPLTAITALTAQNTRGVSAIHACALDALRAQIDAAFEDFDIRAVKIGMLGDAELIDCVADALIAHGRPTLVLDPVMVATSGAVLLPAAALERLIARLFPLSSVITPNIPEAELLLGADARIASADEAQAACAALRALGAAAVLLKGGHLAGARTLDRLDDGSRIHLFEHPRLDVNGHGNGCTLASALACGLAVGRSLADACRDACDYVHGALRHAYRPGRSDVAVLGHDWRLRQRE